MEIDTTLLHSLFESMIGLIHETFCELDPYSAQFPSHIQFDRNDAGNIVSYHISLETIPIQLTKDTFDDIGLYLIYEGTPAIAKTLLVTVKQLLLQTSFLETMVHHDFYPNISLPIDVEESLSLMIRRTATVT